MEIIRYSTSSIALATADHEGGIWMATSSSGLIYNKPTPVYQGNRYDVLRGIPVTALTGRADQELIAGTNCDGLYRISEYANTNYSIEEGIDNECVWSLMEQSDGTLWVGTWGAGVFFKRPGNNRFERFRPAMMRDASVILSIFEDSAGRLWFGSYYNGLFMYDGNDVVSVPHRNGTNLSAVRMVYETQNREIYIASDRGIGSLGPDLRIDKPEELNQLRTRNFRTIATDHSGRLWFGSYGDGIVIKDDDRILTLSAAHGLHDNTVSQLQFDTNGNLWTAGNNGISYIEREQLEQFIEGEIDVLQVIRLGTGEGLRIRETTGGFMPSSYLTDAGQLYIPLVDGIARIETSEISLNHHPPNIFLQEVEINGMISSPDEVRTISFDNQRVIFRFSVISYLNPDYVNAEYRLEGLDQTWQRVSEAREAIYTTLPHGTYTLRIRASNNDGIWNEEGLSYTFTVSPPFWLTWWFILSAILLASLLLFSFYRYRVERIKRANIELEHQVDIRTEELKEVNQELQQLILEKNKMQRVLGHDLRNPLSGIIGYLELLSLDDGDSDNSDQKQIIEMLLDSSRETLNLLENLINFSSGTSAVKPLIKKIPLHRLLTDALSITEIQTSQKDITVTQTGDNSVLIEADQNMLLSVFRNLLSNAVKFSPNGSTITLDVQDRGDETVISVIDQGVGMNKEKVENLFNEQLRNSQLGTMGEKGMGIGLQICKDFIEKHQGSITVESEPGKGSTFFVHLPKVQKTEQAL